MTKVRAFPMPVHPPEGRPANWCRWCGGEITHGRRKERSWHDGREDEPNCKRDWLLHTDRPTQVAYVIRRDGPTCSTCGGAPERWQSGGEMLAFLRPGFGRVDRLDPRIEYVGRYFAISRVSALELEHTIPLWSIAHLTDDERRPFFGPSNLKLMCSGDACHKAKTKAEATVRAKGNRQSKMRLDVPRETSGNFQKGRKMQSRGFAPGHRPMRSRNNLRRS